MVKAQDELKACTKVKCQVVRRGRCTPNANTTIINHTTYG